MLDHVGFTVSDFDRSKRFYSHALAPLSITLLMEVTPEQTGAGAHAGFGADGKPFFWTYLDDKTIDDMVFELELINLSKKNNVQRGSEMLQTAPKEETDKLFEDWDAVAPPKEALADDLKFMQTGEFKK